MSLKKFAALCVTALLFAATSVVILAQEERTWTDSTGKFTVVAVLIEFDGKTVKLKKTSDNLIVTLPLEKLDFSDQSYLRRWKRNEANNPFAGGDPANVESNSDTTGAASGTVRRNVVSVADKIVPGVVTGWHYQPGLMALDGETAGFKPCTVTINQSGGSFGFFGIVEGKNSPLAMMTRENILDKMTTVYIMDMKTGKSFSDELHDYANVWGCSPDGMRIMASSKDFSDKVARTTLEFYSLEDQRMMPNDFSLIPYNDQATDHNKVVEWAAWVTSDHILTINQDKKLRFWEVGKSQAVYEMPLVLETVVMSKDRKAMIVGTHSGVAICDTMTGTTLGMLTQTRPLIMKFDFSPDNTRLLGSVLESRAINTPADILRDNQMEKIVIWDMTTGVKTGEFQTDRGSSPQWVDNRMVLGGHTLYDSESGIPVCYYLGNFQRAVSFRGLFCYLYFVGGNDYILTSAKLPHQAALDAVNTIKAEDRFVIYPGVAVAVDVDVDESVDANVVRENLEKNLKESGFVLDDAAAIRLTATIKKGETIDVNYNNNRRDFPGFPSFPIRVIPRLVPSPLGGTPIEVDVKITPYESSIAITNGDKELWKTTTSSVPQRLEIDKDRSLQEVADELCKPDLDFFAEAELPRYHTGEALQIRSNTSALIHATLTPTGVR